MSSQIPLPFAFSRREEFLGLPLERRTTHLWTAYAFCQDQLGKERFADDELNRNLRVLRRMMLAVAKAVAVRLRDDGSWKNALDERWPRNHKGADPDHWYDSGAFPPRFLALPADPAACRDALAKDTEALAEEMIAWVETPAGQAGVGDVELQQLLVERDFQVPQTESAQSDVPHPETQPLAIEQRTAGLEWLSSKSGDGTLLTWAKALKLPGIEQLLGGATSNHRTMDRLLPELMHLEASGEWEALQRHLDVESQKDAGSLAKLRSCLPKGRA